MRIWLIGTLIFVGLSSARGAPAEWSNYSCAKFEGVVRYRPLEQSFSRSYGLTFPQDGTPSYRVWYSWTAKAKDCSSRTIACLEEPLQSSGTNNGSAKIVYAVPKEITTEQKYTIDNVKFRIEYWVTQPGFSYLKQAVIYATPEDSDTIGPYKFYLKADVGIVSLFYSRLPNPRPSVFKESHNLADITCNLQSEKGLFSDSTLHLTALPGNFND